MKLIGTEAKKKQIEKLLNANRSHFMAVYGRRKKLFGLYSFPPTNWEVVPIIISFKGFNDGNFL